MRKSTSIQSVFKNRNPDLLKIFAEARHPR
jgi:hypothetical protein